MHTNQYHGWIHKPMGHMPIQPLAPMHVYTSLVHMCTCLCPCSYTPMTRHCTHLLHSVPHLSTIVCFIFYFILNHMFVLGWSLWHVILFWILFLYLKIHKQWGTNEWGKPTATCKYIWSNCVWETNGWSWRSHKNIDHFREMYKIYLRLNFIYIEIWKIPRCNWLDLETLGSRPIIPTNLPETL